MWTRALLVFMPLGMSACIGIACNEMGCMGGLTLDLSPGLSDVGTYELVLTGMDGAQEELRCAFSIDDVGRVALDDCSDSLFDLEPANGAPVGLIRARVGGDMDYHLAFFHQRSVVMDEVVEPDWVPGYPNGRRCGAACYTAELTVDLGPE